MRFNPSDLNAWNLWVQEGLYDVATFRQDRGDLSAAIATQQSIVALGKDPRRPSSFRTAGDLRRLAVLQAEVGDSAAAARSLQAYRRAVDGEIAAMSPTDSVRQLVEAASAADIAEAQVQLAAGNAGAALAHATAALHRLDAVKTRAGTLADLQNNANLNRLLPTAAVAALVAGDNAQAESYARRWQALPPSGDFSDDPRTRTSYIAVVLAHALAGQGKNADADKALQPALAYYREQQKAGASGMQFRHHFAQALVVDALASASAGDAGGGGGARRNADLAEAAQLIDTAPAEARNTTSFRRVAGWIAKARKRGRR